MIEAELGRGSMGVVYRARAADPRPDEPEQAALKILTHSLARDPGFLQRFPAEMLTLRRLGHPNIVRYYDSGIHAGTAYYAMELVDGAGVDLAARLRDQPKNPGEPGLSWREEVLSIAAQMARGLKHGHHRSLLHRDLKPTNVLMTAEGLVKLADFGIAKIFQLAPLSLPGDPTGTAGYLAPEHFTGKPVTRRSDLYALGGVLYTLVTGRPPFPPGTAAELMHKHCYVLPDRPIQYVPKLPAEVDDLICSLLVKDPNRRPASAAAFLEELDRARAKLERKGERISIPPAPNDPTGTHTALPADALSASSGPRRDQLIRGVVLGVLLLLVISGILFAFFR
ncbi:MAG: serine/threonine-protein kinase, partial [Gemmataceae bacterium]